MKGDGVYVKFHGKTYRVRSEWRCNARACSLFKRGVCDDYTPGPHKPLPCDRIVDLFKRDCGVFPDPVTFKEIAE